MTEEDLSALVTSIDENDIIIIPSNGSDINDQLDFATDHFTINERRVDPPIVPIQTRRLSREISEVNLNKFLVKFCYFNVFKGI